ncbi:restriction endonuclease subunit S [Pantoea eucrina]|uniref:restriction endonuclease subunit S n=1 Tax=Pantoea eucrina TaxID=472693 RepID=UPI00301C112D
MSVEQLITQHINTWTSALQTRSTAGRGNNGKIDLYGIKKLRELILELAVRGKLVPQDPNDEPASELLKQIAKERDELVKRKVIRKPKKLEKITNTKIPFELPNGWEWCYLNDIGDWGAGSTPNRSNLDYYNGNIPWFKSGELHSDFISDSEEKVTELALQECSLRNNNVGDVLIAMYGATIGKTSILNVRGTTNQAVCACTPYSGVSNIYLLTFLKAYKRVFIGMSAGGAQPNISREKLIATVFALPPKAEQNRIICKVNQLMSLCDQLEQQSLTSMEAHSQLVETLLATLTSSQNAEELAENWARISQHFDTLFTTEASIDALKQTILQLAVMGKLVPQDPNDEPASELLKRIEQKKAQLVKEGEIKKQKPLPPVSDEEKPFELPVGWEWCRLGTLFSFQNGYAFKSEWFSDSGIRLVRNANISHGFISWDDSVRLPESMLSQFEGFGLNIGDVVISLDRPIINSGLKYAFIRECDLPCLLLQRVAKFNSVGNLILSGFLSKWLESNYFTNAIDPGRSNGVPHISTKQLEMTLFPLLSQSEQSKIILKTNELIQVCEQLKSCLQSAQQTQLHLADALTNAALS